MGIMGVMKVFSPMIPMIPIFPILVLLHNNPRIVASTVAFALNLQECSPEGEKKNRAQVV
jgi:hypothetical protein